MTADCQTSGLNMEMIQLQEDFHLSQAKVCGLMKKEEATGGQYLSMLTTNRGIFIQALGMTTLKNTVSLQE